jgi:hypothetical protein
VILKTPNYDWQAKVLLAIERGSKNGTGKDCRLRTER